MFKVKRLKGFLFVVNIRGPQLFKWTQIKLEIVSFPFRGHFEGRNGSDSLVKLENRCQTAGQQKRFKENRSRMLLVFAMLDRIGKRLVSHVNHFRFFSSYSSNYMFSVIIFFMQLAKMGCI